MDTLLRGETRARHRGTVQLSARIAVAEMAANSNLPTPSLKYRNRLFLNLNPSTEVSSASLDRNLLVILSLVQSPPHQLLLSPRKLPHHVPLPLPPLVVDLHSPSPLTSVTNPKNPSRAHLSRRESALLAAMVQCPAKGPYYRRELLKSISLNSLLDMVTNRRMEGGERRRLSLVVVEGVETPWKLIPNLRMVEKMMINLSK